MSKSSKITGLFLLCAPLWAAACVPAGDGKRPSPEDIYFPVAVVLSEDAEHLFVVNSDFDLQYAQGTIQSLRVARLRELSRTPCSTDADCSGGDICDTEPSEENDRAPSFFCVPADDPRPCGDLGEKPPEKLALAPGRCSPILLDEPPDGGEGIIEDAAETSAFATQGLLLSRPCLEGGIPVPCAPDVADGERIQQLTGTSQPERLFVPIRGDTTIHYLDVSDGGRFTCGRIIEELYEDASYRDSRTTQDLRCGSTHRIADGTTFALDDSGRLVTTDEPPDPDEDEKERKQNEDDPREQFRLPPEPYELASNSDGRVIVVSHQLHGRASTLVNSWVHPPALVHILAGLDPNPIGVSALDSVPGAPFFDFLLTYRSTAEVELLRFADNGLLAASLPDGPSGEQLAQGATVFRPELSLLATSGITLNSLGVDSRGIVVDSTVRQAAIVDCGADTDCLAVAEQVPLDVYVANRSPNSLLVGRSGGTDADARTSKLPEFYMSVPLTAGPSRVVVGFVTNTAGEKERRVFVLCFDSALIYVFDPDRARLEGVIRTGRGPYSMAFDPEEPLAYVAHFTDSHLGVVSLDQRHRATYGVTLATFGDPVEPRAAE